MISSLSPFQYTDEQRRVDSLENLLSQGRKKVSIITTILYYNTWYIMIQEFQAQVSGQERETEIEHLKQQLTRLENDQ